MQISTSVKRSLIIVIPLLTILEGVVTPILTAKSTEVDKVLIMGCKDTIRNVMIHLSVSKAVKPDSTDTSKQLSMAAFLLLMTLRLFIINFNNYFMIFVVA